MSDEMMFKVVEKALEDLQEAQREADRTPRPANACPAHDSQFALTKAISGALGTLLMMAQQALKDGVPNATDSTLTGKTFALLLRPWPWIFASVAVFSPNIIGIINTLKEIGK